MVLMFIIIFNRDTVLREEKYILHISRPRPTQHERIFSRLPNNMNGFYCRPRPKHEWSIL